MKGNILNTLSSYERVRKKSEPVKDEIKYHNKS